MSTKPVVIDTNTFVAAGFNPDSHSSRILDKARTGQLQLVWNQETRRETKRVVTRIPPLDWNEFEGLFMNENRYDGPTHESAFRHVPDPADRKFAALASAADAILITQDGHLLGSREESHVFIVTPGEFFERVRID